MPTTLIATGGALGIGLAQSGGDVGEPVPVLGHDGTPVQERASVA